MKYLKRFNEAVSEDNIDLCCVDLYDYGFELKGFSKPGEPTVISLTKTITSDMPEWDGTPGTDVRGEIIWDEHLSKYQPGTITIRGLNFDKISMVGRQKLPQFKNNQVPLSDEENKLISMLSDAANILIKYSDKHFPDPFVNIAIMSRGLQNPMNFQYERYRTIIDILFYL